MNEILTPVLLLGIMGILFAAILGYAANAFKVEIDPKVDAVRNALPGANCGGCGFPGCDSCAEAIALNGAPTNSCPVGGAAVAEEIAEIMGVAAAVGEKEVACVMCQGSPNYAKEKFKYKGVQDCSSLAQIQGGNKACNYGCLGCGSCVKVCEFDAIHIVNGIALVDKDKCVACKKCVAECPKKLIDMVPYSQKFMVKCKSLSKGKDVRAACNVGCIACKICEKQCPDGFKVENNLSHFTNLEGLNEEEIRAAVDKCPTKCIYPGLPEKEAAEGKEEAAV